MYSLVTQKASAFVKSPSVRSFALQALVIAVVLLLIPERAMAQTMFTQATGFMQDAIKVVGWVMVLGGLILMLMGGFGVKEGRGGWPAIAVGVVLIFVGFKVSGGITSAGQIFG